MLFIKELNPELNTQKDYSRQTLYMTLRANTLLFAYFHFVIRLLRILLHLYSFSFSFSHVDLIMTLSERRKRRRIFKLLIKMLFNFLKF